VKLRLAKTAAIAAPVAAAMAAAPVTAAKINAPAQAKVVKPLVLKSVQDLDLGSILLGPGSWSGAVVQLTRGGAFTCPAAVACSGATQVAVYNLSGSNKQTIVINAPDVTMVNQSDPTKSLTLFVDSPGTVTLTNSGAQGQNFPIGGSISVDSTTPDGVYVGTFEVTAEYQ
jgi:hypothetical protein